jgi:hypothetical protein
VDVTAATMLGRIAARLGERGARLVLADLPAGRPGKHLRVYVERLGLDRPPHGALIFEHLDEALEWAEQRVLARELAPVQPEVPLAVAELELFRGLPAEALRAIEAEVRERALAPGEQVFACGDPGTELFLVRSGAVRILLPLPSGKGDVLATVGRGELFGEMGFTDLQSRSAAAVAAANTLVYALSRDGLGRASAAHPPLEALVLSRVAQVLAARLRSADVDRQALREA